jgi:hypothetical protein
LRPMPPEVINVAPGHTEYIEVNAERENKLYEWSLTLEISIDQRRERRSFGSQARPLRSWGGPFPSSVYVFPRGADSWQPGSY